jgi:hypothetical protein
MGHGGIATGVKGNNKGKQKIKECETLEFQALLADCNAVE